jgi:hypothetical protein
MGQAEVAAQALRGLAALLFMRVALVAAFVVHQTQPLGRTCIGRECCSELRRILCVEAAAEKAAISGSIGPVDWLTYAAAAAVRVRARNLVSAPFHETWSFQSAGAPSRSSGYNVFLPRGG